MVAAIPVLNHRLKYATHIYRVNLRIGKLNQAYWNKVKSKGILGYYQDLEHCSQEYCQEQLELQGRGQVL